MAGSHPPRHWPGARRPIGGSGTRHGQRAVNVSHAKIRAVAEQAMAALKCWRLLRKLRCSTTRITVLVKAALTLHLTAAAGSSEGPVL